MVYQTYVNDIIFEGMSSNMIENFAQQMQSKIKMSLVGELPHFLGFRVKQMKYGIFMSQSKYAKNNV